MFLYERDLRSVDEDQVAKKNGKVLCATGPPPVTSDQPMVYFGPFLVAFIAVLLFRCFMHPAGTCVSFRSLLLFEVRAILFDVPCASTHDYVSLRTNFLFTYYMSMVSTTPLSCCLFRLRFYILVCVVSHCVTTSSLNFPFLSPSDVRRV